MDSDPSVMAESELIGAASSIDAAAVKLAELRPRIQPKVRYIPVFMLYCL